MQRIILLIVLFYVMDIESQNYGPFDVKVVDVQLCKGPKRRTCYTGTFDVINGVNMTIDVVVTENITHLKGHFLGSFDNSKLGKLVMNDPCRHLFIKPILQSLLKITDDCTIMKGHYVSTLNLAELVTKYYRGSFLYGRWTYKTLFYNDYCNFSCTVLKLDFIPKKKLNS